MARDTKILQSILDGQTSIKKGLNEGFKNVDLRFDGIDKRIDKLGLQLANLEEDAPTIEEFEGLEKKVVKIQKRLALS